MTPQCKMLLPVSLRWPTMPEHGLEPSRDIPGFPSVLLCRQSDFGHLQRPKDFQFADNGAIKSVSDEQMTEGVENAVVQGDGLLLTVKDPGTQQPDHYVMRFTVPGMAELKMVAMSMPPGMPKPQPWKLSKVTPSAITPVR